MKQATKTSGHTEDGNPALLGVSEIHQRQYPHFFCLSNDIGITSDAVIATHTITLHRLCNPNILGLLLGMFLSDTHQFSNKRTSKPPKVQTLPTTWKWSWIFSDNGLTHNTDSALGTWSMTATVLYKSISQLTLFSGIGLYS